MGNSCAERYPEGMPDYCQVKGSPDLIESSREKYLDPEVAKIHLAISKLQDRQKTAGELWPRVKEAIEFSRELKVTKVGIAVCISMLRECAEFAKLLRQSGLEVCTASCMAGGLGKAETGIPEEWMAPACNPVIQAEILNRAGTELNFIYGLCMGHDTLFIQNSEAPVSIMVVKDRVTVNNPGAVLFSFYHRRALWAEYGGDPGGWDLKKIS